jgi:hypothetical protein
MSYHLLGNDEQNRTATIARICILSLDPVDSRACGRGQGRYTQ